MVHVNPEVRECLGCFGIYLRRVLLGAVPSFVRPYVCQCVFQQFPPMGHVGARDGINDCVSMSEDIALIAVAFFAFRIGGTLPGVKGLGVVHGV